MHMFLFWLQYQNYYYFFNDEKLIIIYNYQQIIYNTQ